MVSFIVSLVLIALSLEQTLACNFHTNYQSRPRLGRRQVKRAEGREVLDWDYRASFDWHTIRPEYHLCHAGTSQSPINLHRSQGLAQKHAPDFSGYVKPGSEQVAGNFFNWGFGPAYTVKHEGEDFTTLPALKFDDRTVYLSGWHIHFPSEHLIDGVRSKAEMHFVHVDEKGEAASVVGIRIDVTSKPEHKSEFFEQLGPNLIGFNDTAVMEGVMISPMKAIEEAGGVKEYWTYQGSLTTPPCSEGLRWFLPAQPLWVNKEQMVSMLESGRFSHRVEQVVWEQGINV